MSEQNHAIMNVPTFLVLWKTEVNVPARYKDHVILEVFPLNLSLLHYHDVGLEHIKHGLASVSIHEIKELNLPGKSSCLAMVGNQMDSWPRLAASLYLGVAR
jgi:hypothetical protein